MEILGFFLMLFVYAALGTLFLTRGVMTYLNKKAILDKPNHRSSHTVPTPRGGGLAVIPIILAGWAVAIGGWDEYLASWHMAAWAGAALLSGFSWWDDRHENGLPVRVRLGAQVMAAALPLLFLPEYWVVFDGLLPLWLDRLITLFGFLWFINLFNFMDGIDGISGGEAASIGSGIILLYFIHGMGSTLNLCLALLVVGACLGFLVWNWHPGKIFLGDVGSIGLGYLCGWMLIFLASIDGFWPALILPLYYLMDASITLIKRALKHEKIWQAHRKHYYQAATVPGGLKHDTAVKLIILVNVLLVLLALESVRFKGWMLVPAVLVVYILLRFFRRVQKKAQEKV